MITIPVLAVLQKTLGWLLDMTSTDFIAGVLGAAAVFLVWYLAEREERINSGPSFEEKSTRRSCRRFAAW